MKKRLLLSAVLFVCSFQLFSQDTLANMLEVGNKWARNGFTEITQPKPFLSEEVLKDTLINNLKFYKIRHISNMWRGADGNIESIIYMRFDKNKMLIGQYDNSTNQYIINVMYEFLGTNVGDVIKVNKSYSTTINDTMTIFRIDTVMMNGKKIRKFGLRGKNGNSISFNAQYLDGVGTIGGGLYFIASINGQYLICFKNNQGTFDSNLQLVDESSCYTVITNINNNSLSSQITLSKPTENQLQLNTELDFTNAQISIHDMKGSKYNCSLQQNNLVDIAALSAGLYILKLQTADNKLASFKFVK